MEKSVRKILLFPTEWKNKIKCSKASTRNKLEGNWEQRTTWAAKAAPWTWGRLEQIVLLHKVFGVFLASQHKGCHFQGIGVQPQIWFRSLLSIQYIHVQYTQELWFSQTLFLGILNLWANPYIIMQKSNKLGIQNPRHDQSWITCPTKKAAYIGCYNQNQPLNVAGQY